jgi:hypothetical protein
LIKKRNRLDVTLRGIYALNWLEWSLM